MLRKTLVTLTAVVVLGVGSAAMARGGGGGWGGGWGGGGGWRGGGGWGGASMHGMGMGVGHPMAAARGMTFGSRNFGPNRFAWSHEHFHDFRFHHRFRNRFFAFGFDGPYLYDYAYGSCWTQIPTRYGWHWAYVCGDGAY